MIILKINIILERDFNKIDLKKKYEELIITPSEINNLTFFKPLFSLQAKCKRLSP
jgi:hypothetical protein